MTVKAHSDSSGLWQYSGGGTSSNMTRIAVWRAASGAIDAMSPQSRLPTVIGRMVSWNEVQTQTCKVTGRTVLRVVCPT